VTADPPGALPPADTLPPWLGVEPPEAPLLRADEPWSQPIEDINKTKPARANNPDKAFNATLAMVLPFISGYPSIDKAVPTCEV
jgi:hypothetical protein